MLSFFLMFATMLVLSSIFTNGWYAITRGRWETRPNGSVFWTGKIFSNWHRFFQAHKIVKTYYAGDEFLKKWEVIKGFFNDKDILELTSNSAIVNMKVNDVLKLRAYGLSKCINLDHRPFSNPDTAIITIYSNEKKYRFSDLVKDPLGMCITCFASIYGTLMFVFWYLLMKHFAHNHEIKSAILFIELPVYLIIGLWAVFCISLAYLNELFNHLNEKLKK